MRLPRLWPWGPRPERAGKGGEAPERREPARPRAVPAEPRRLDVHPLGRVDPAQVREVARELERRLRLRVAVAEPVPLLPEWWDGRRRQHDSNAVVDWLVDRHEQSGRDPDSEWTLALTAEDLFAEDRAFVFGEATLGGCCALVGLARLEGALERAVREAVHELAHVAGMEHCDLPDCLMSPAEDVADIDRRGGEFCPGCSEAARRLGILGGA